MKKYQWIVALTLTLVCTSCMQTPPEPTQTPYPTYTVASTYTPYPTQTQQPTSKPITVVVTPTVDIDYFADYNKDIYQLLIDSFLSHTKVQEYTQAIADDSDLLYDSAFVEEMIDQINESEQPYNRIWEMDNPPQIMVPYHIKLMTAHHYFIRAYDYLKFSLISRNVDDVHTAEEYIEKANNLLDDTQIEINHVSTEVANNKIQQQTNQISTQKFTPIPPISSHNSDPDAIVLSGTGDDVVDIEKITDDMVAAHIIGNDGATYFSIKAIYNNSENDSLVGTIDPYDGIVPIFNSQNLEMFEITSKSDWKIVIFNINTLPTYSSSENINGSGDSLFLIDQDSKKLHITGNDNASYFSVIAHTLSGDYDSLVGTVDPYDGIVLFPEDTYMIEVKANGGWSINP